MLKRRLVLSTLGLLALAAAVTTVSVVGSASARKPSRKHTPPHKIHRSAARQASDAASALSAFSVLSKPATSGGAPSNAAGVKVSARFPVWVTDEGGEICLSQEGINGPGIGVRDCATHEQALAGKLVMMNGIYASHGTESEVVGLAPDGNASVQATDTDGASRAVSVSDNVYEIVGNAPRTITLHDASGQATTQEVPGA